MYGVQHPVDTVDHVLLRIFQRPYASIGSGKLLLQLITFRTQLSALALKFECLALIVKGCLSHTAPCSRLALLPPSSAITSRFSRLSGAIRVHALTSHAKAPFASDVAMSTISRHTIKLNQK